MFCIKLDNFFAVIFQQLISNQTELGAKFHYPEKADEESSEETVTTDFNKLLFDREQKSFR